MNSQLDTVLENGLDSTGAKLSALYYVGKNTIVTHEGIRNLRALAVGKVGALAEDLIAAIDDLEDYITPFKLFDKPSHRFSMIDSISYDLYDKIRDRGEFLFNVAGSKFYKYNDKYYVNSALLCHEYSPIGEISADVMTEYAEFLEHVKYTNDKYRFIKDCLNEI